MDSVISTQLILVSLLHFEDALQNLDKPKMDLVQKMGSALSSLKNGHTLGSLIATPIDFGLHFAEQNLDKGPSIYNVSKITRWVGSENFNFCWHIMIHYLKDTVGVDVAKAQGLVNY